MTPEPPLSPPDDPPEGPCVDLSPEAFQRAVDNITMDSPIWAELPAEVQREHRRRVREAYCRGKVDDVVALLPALERWQRNIVESALRSAWVDGWCHQSKESQARARRSHAAEVARIRGERP